MPREEEPKLPAPSGGLAPIHHLIDERAMGGKKFGGQAVFPALLDKSGRVVVPKEWRKVLGLKGGDMVYIVLWRVEREGEAR